MKSQALFIQLARLGDLVQSLPAFSSLKTKSPGTSFDLIVPTPLVPIASLFPQVHRVLSWKGQDWHKIVQEGNGVLSQQISLANHYWARCAVPSYDVAYNLNNHPRGILLAHLSARQVVGPGEHGPLHPEVPAWARYLQEVAQDRGQNRIHLADAFCGLCGVRPPMHIPSLGPESASLPDDLNHVVQSSSLKGIAVILGAGDRERQVPVGVWQNLIESTLQRLPNSQIFLIGGPGEREISLTLENQLPSACLNRVVNACGRTTLTQLLILLRSCRWVIGSDTGPFHLGILAGARGIGWYFSRARVHETGPYGVGHFVWQYEKGGPGTRSSGPGYSFESVQPVTWPVSETVDLMSQGPCEKEAGAWTLWESCRDEWGMYYHCEEIHDEGVHQRNKIWSNLSSENTVPIPV